MTLLIIVASCYEAALSRNQCKLDEKTQNPILSDGFGESQELDNGVQECENGRVRSREMDIQPEQNAEEKHQGCDKNHFYNSF
jgi:hypothetical protein